MIVMNPKITGLWYGAPTDMLSTHGRAPMSAENMIELAARNCYQSFDKIDPESFVKLFHMLLSSGHGVPFEFGEIYISIITDRGVLAELTRHRLCSFCVESTRYVNDAKDTEVKAKGCRYIRPVIADRSCIGDYGLIDPSTCDINTLLFAEDEFTMLWLNGCKFSELQYLRMAEQVKFGGLGIAPQFARSMLNNSTKTQILMKCNFRELMHIFNLRCAAAAHPEIQRIFIPVLAHCIKTFPSVFGHLMEMHSKSVDEWNAKDYDIAEVELISRAA